MAVLEIPLWMYLATWVVSIILAWLSSPPWQRAVQKAGDRIEEWAEALPPKHEALVMAAIQWTEENFSDLSGAARMARCIGYLNHFGLPVTPGQVQAVYDVMKAVGLFGKEAA